MPDPESPPAKLKPGQLWYIEDGYKIPIALINEFDERVDKLIDEMFGKDGDGDYPVRVDTTDLTRYERIHAFCVPHLHKCATEQEQDDRLSLLILNAQSLLSVLDRDLRQRNLKRREAKAKQDAASKENKS